jgi:hypothetical protein
LLYYVVYNPEYWERDKHEPFEVYRLLGDKYVRQAGEPVWIPEISLGIGRGRGSYDGWEREWLYWYDQGKPISSDERTALTEQELQQERQRAEQERQLREDLIARLRSRGIDPDAL